MNQTPGPIFDSHVHLDLIAEAQPHRIDWLRRQHCRVVSWAFGQGIATVQELHAYLRRQADLIGDINLGTGLDCRFMAGIHPRNIPRELKPEAVADLLKPYLRHPLCVGIGEIGLEGGSILEQEILTAQLELALEVHARPMRVGIHTPRQDKLRVTTRTLEILGGFTSLRPWLVVDHCTRATLKGVLDAGWRAGVTLSPVKVSLAELRGMLADDPRAAAAIMCNTDSGSEFHEDLATARDRPELDDEIKAKLLYGNAAAFFDAAADPQKSTIPV